MRSILLISALVGLADAVPSSVPRTLTFVPSIHEDHGSNFILVFRAGRPAPLDQRTDVNEACAVQPVGYDPKTTSPDTAADLLANSAYSVSGTLAQPHF